MHPVGEGKNAMVGFMAGFAFGPIGVGLYLRSVSDFVMTLGMVLIGTFMTAGVGAPLFWVLCGAWAFVRIRNSNKEMPRVEEPKSVVDGPSPQ